MSFATDGSAPPSPLLMALEMRAFFELQAFFLSYPMLKTAPRGDGHPVLVLPGLAAGDASTLPLRAYLKSQGYAAHGWKLGQNRGRRPGAEEAAHARLVELVHRYGRKVSLVGWSLGGVFARELARQSPELVRQVISLGSPIASKPKSTNGWRLYEALSGRSAEDWPNREEMMTAPPVPSTAIYSRTDGVVAWQGCLEEEGVRTQNIEVQASHMGLGHHPLALYVIADRLALPEDEWAPFDRGGSLRCFYPQPGSRVADAAVAH